MAFLFDALGGILVDDPWEGLDSTVGSKSADARGENFGNSGWYRAPAPKSLLAEETRHGKVGLGKLKAATLSLPGAFL